MINQNKSFEDIYDILAIRIIVNTIGECYQALGIIHAHYTPVPKRFKDYIAVPKPNMYQSFAYKRLLFEFEKHSYPIEVQIRTHEMHKIAEYGIAAHWKYKEGVSGATAMDDRLGWVKEVLSYDNDLRDSTVVFGPYP